MAAITEPARAKVNLTLRVLGYRPDGYHAIESLVVFADSVADRITWTPGASRAIETTGPFAADITGRNLVEAALEAVAAAVPEAGAGAVRLEKHIPAGGGLGGGSADAAAMLRALRRANPSLEGAVDWSGIAAGLGADVPVCLADRAALVSGIGDRFSMAPDLPPLHAVLVNPLTVVPADKTARVFRALGAKEAGAEHRQAPSLPSFGRDMGAMVDWLQRAGNDLHPPARTLMPAIDAVLAALAEMPACLLARMSGAGPTCFGLYPSEEAAAAAARMLAATRPDWWVRPTGLG